MSIDKGKAADEVTSIKSLSVELLCLIFTNCDTFNDALCLASTCTQLRKVWKANESSILTPLARRFIPAFDEALVASRVTAFVTNIFMEGKVPPKAEDIDIASFSAQASPPRAWDMAPVLRFSELAKVVQTKYFYKRPVYQETQSAATIHVHRAVYRVLLAGPVLSGCFFEPFYVDGAVSKIRPSLPYQLHAFAQSGIALSPHDLKAERVSRHLEQYPAYDQEANVKLTAALDPVFGSLSRWLISSIKDHITNDDILWAEMVPAPPASDLLKAAERGQLSVSNTNKQEILVILREVMRMLAVHHILADSIEDLTKGDRYGQQSKVPGTPPAQTPPNGCKTSPKFPAIILGTYHPDEFQIVYDFDIVKSSPITPWRGAIPGPKSLGNYHEQQPRSLNLFNLQLRHFKHSGAINEINGHPAPRPNIQLFAFMLKHYFNTEFKPYPGSDWPDEADHEFFRCLLTRARIFDNPTATLTPVWLAQLRPASQDPVYSHGRYRPFLYSEFDFQF